MTTAVDTETNIYLVEDETQALITWAEAVETAKLTVFEKARQLVTRLGAHYRPDGLTEIGFWTPELIAQVMRKSEIYLEVLTPLEEIDPRSPRQKIDFRRDRFNLVRHGEFYWGVIAGMRPGNRTQFGSFYWLRYIDQNDKLRAIRDVVPYSLPFGVFAPAELYDMEGLQKNRADLNYFARTGASPLPQVLAGRADIDRPAPRINAPGNILQLHVGTATNQGTLEGLTKLYHHLSDKVELGHPLTPAEEAFIGYDAVQLLPIEPTIEFRTDYSPESEFFNCVAEKDEILTIELAKPNTQDWGYDVPILGSSAVNPALLGSLRPDETIDFIATLHNFSTGPIQIIYDLVYGHADNQSELLLHREFLKGPNMYGQDLNHQLPTVRAIFLEMQRRKINTGADGIRVDGGQDFRYFNPMTGTVDYDDAYLMAMADVEQEIGGHRRLLFTIYEDGRPWPAEGWEEISTYRELIEMKPESYQWGPLIFAHNTPSLQGFWDRKWRRVCEVMFQGENWITGCANHDTVRRGNQVDPDRPINWNLGKTLPEVLDNAYDNPAVTMWVYGFSPGLPMDFINATTRSPWMFFRNTDERYGVKVVSEEFGFLDWQIDNYLYDRDDNFSRMKALGFESLEQLKEFGKALQDAMAEKDYNLADVAEACQMCLGDSAEACSIESLKLLNRPGMVEFLKELDVDKLKSFALQFMEDSYEVCNVGRYEHQLEETRTKFNLSLRRFRLDRPWLAKNLVGIDRFDKFGDSKRTVYYGMRTNPEDESDRVAMVTHMGGKPITVNLTEWMPLELEDWQVAIATTDLAKSDRLEHLDRFKLYDSEGVLFVYRPRS